MTFLSYKRFGREVSNFPRVDKAHCRIACLILVFAQSLACDNAGSPTDPVADPVTDLDLVLETEHFRLLYNQVDGTRMDAYSTELEAAYARITTDLDQMDLARIEGRFYPDQASYTAFTGHSSLGSVQGPNLFSIVTITTSYNTSVPVHEFAHCVMLHLDGQAGNNPTWLWEAVAIYEAQDFVPPIDVPCLASHNFPTLTQLNERGGSCDIYKVGYTLTEYIVEGWGTAGLRALITAHGDPRETLGISVEELQSNWWRFLENRYL